MGDGTAEGRGRRPRRLPVAAVLGIALTLIATGCGSNTPVHPVPFAHARALFREICAGCHTLADAGATGLRKSLDNSAFSIVGTRYPLGRYVIEHGDSTMPDWQGSLTPKEIRELTVYLVHVTGKSRHSADGRRATILTPNHDPWTTHPPSRADGKAVFKEICAGCHTLADAGAHGTRVDLDAALASVPDRAAVVRNALKVSPSMPDWTARLPANEIDSLVIYVSEVAGRGR